MSIGTEDDIYFNIDIQNREIELKKAEFDSNRVDAVLKNTGSYRVAVERFTVPTSLIPIRHNQNLLDEFSVSLSVGGINFTEQVLSSDIDNGTKFILSFQDITKPISLAFERAFSQLKIAIPALTSTEAPKLTMYESTALFLVRIPLSYYTDNIDIWIDDRMYGFFQFPTKYFPDPTVPGYVNSNKLDYYDNGINTDLTLGYTFFYQPFSTATLFADLKQFFFETDKMPIEGELIGGQRDKSRAILTDFDPIERPLINKTRLNFSPQGPLRWYELTGNMGLRNIDLRVFYTTTTDDIIRNIQLKKDEFCAVKLHFRKKDINLT